jgi:hypothetical protein
MFKKLEILTSIHFSLSYDNQDPRKSSTDLHSFTVYHFFFLLLLGSQPQNVTVFNFFC